MLVHGATGAIGSAAVQLLVDLGVHVVATAPTAHVELVRGLGAERVVDHQAQDFTRTESGWMPSSTWSGRAPSGRAGGS